MATPTGAKPSALPFASPTELTRTASASSGLKSNTCGSWVLLLQPGTRECRGGASPPWAPPRRLSGARCPKCLAGRSGWNDRVGRARTPSGHQALARPLSRWRRSAGPEPCRSLSGAIKRAKQNARRNLLAACALMSSQLLAGAQHLRAYSIRYAEPARGSIGFSTYL